MVSTAVRTLLVLTLLAPMIQAHDIPNARVDRAIQVLLNPGRLRIDYEVGLAELTLAQDLRALEGTLPKGGLSELFERYGEVTGPLNARGLLVSVDGYPVSLELIGFDLTVEEHPLYLFRFEATIPEQGQLAVQDTNYTASEGTSRLAFRAEGGVKVQGYDGPLDVEDVPIQPVWMLSDDEERRTKQVEVDYRDLTAAETTSNEAKEASDGSEADSKRLVQDEPEAHVPTDSSSQGLALERLSRLLDRRSGWSWLGLLVSALVLGSAHAFQPGHGKTIVAATVVGERGRWSQGVLLALVTTVCHTLGVLAIAALLWLTRTTRYEAINTALLQVAGFLIAAIGLWRLGRHLGRHGEHDEDREQPVANRNILVLGMAAGMIPCWDAILLIVLAEALGKLALGVVLLLSFGLGMALVLIGVGVGTARLRGLRFVQSRRWERWIGMIGGLLLALIGIGMIL